MSDYILFFEYSAKQTVKKILTPLNDTALLNDTLAHCTLMNEKEEGFEFYCEESNPYFASLTLTFIYLPSLNVIAAIYGQWKAGEIGFVFGFMMVVSGIVWYILLHKTQSSAELSINMTLIFLGSGMIGLGMKLGQYIDNNDNDNGSNNFEKIKLWLPFCIFFPLFVAFSPLIFVIIKLLGVLQKESKLVTSQSKIASRGEGLFEAAPQLILQLYIVLVSSSSPSLGQWFSIITSIPSIPIPIVKQYLTARTEDLGFKNSILKIAIFLPASPSRLLSIAISAMFLREWTVVFYLLGAMLSFVSWNMFIYLGTSLTCIYVKLSELK